MKNSLKGKEACKAFIRYISKLNDIELFMANLYKIKVRYIEELNMRAEQLAFIGRAMEREQVEMPLSEYMLTAALEKAEEVMSGKEAC
jgi:uncharacterized protein (DUF1778 family)